MAERTSFRRAATYFDKKMVPPLQQQLIGRKLFASTLTLPKGKFELDYDTITEMGSAIISYDLPDDSTKRDMIEATDANLKLAVISKGWKIPRSQWEAYLSEGKDLRTKAMISAAQVNGLAEDDLLMQSWKPDGSTAKINGLYGSAGNTDSTSADFGTFGNAMAEVGTCLAAIAADDVPTASVNWNLSLNSVQYYELAQSIDTGVREFEEVVKMLNPAAGMPAGGIFMSPDITADTGMLSPVDPSGQYIELVVGQNMKNVLGEDSKIPDISPIYGTTYEVIAPVVYQTDAICTMTGI